jgi:ABC-type multidrug transport system permease subunit
VVLLAVLDALLGTALGLLLSAFARTEFQAVQFLPAVILPQLLLCGLFAPREAMAAPLQVAVRRLPADVRRRRHAARRRHAGRHRRTGHDLAVVLGCVVGFLALGSVTLPRRSE